MVIRVSAQVLEGIEAIRESGETNMLDHERVIQLLDEMGFDQAATWVNENVDGYVHGVFYGFEVGG